jgi:hypothetical protein
MNVRSGVWFRDGWSVIGWAALVFFLAVALPLFLCMPPWLDTTFFDLSARTLLEGGVLYRDIFIHGLPGFMLILAPVRAIAGWRSETLRALDFLIVITITSLLIAFVRPRSGRFVPWFAAAILVCYFSMNESGQCQPDGWMLLPALAAADLRRRQCVDLLAGQERAARLAGRGLIEGSCWGVAMLIKPFAAVPAVATWLVSWAALHRNPTPRRRDLALDAASVTAGAALIGALCATWLKLSGNWPYFMAAVFSDWNTDYYRSTAGISERLRSIYEVAWPWGLVQIVAIGLATANLVRLLWGARGKLQVGHCLLCACYLAWMVQAYFIQRVFLYHIVPTLLLAIGVIGAQFSVFSVQFSDGNRAATAIRVSAFAAVALFGVWVIVKHPLLQSERLAWWPICWRERSSPRVRDALTLAPDRNVAADWAQLDNVRTYLAEMHLQDGQLTCFGVSTTPLYLSLHLKPSIRYVLIWTTLMQFRNHAGQIAGALDESRQIYVVNDLKDEFTQGNDAYVFNPGYPFGLPPFPAGLVNRFPWTEPIVFRSGRYLVHRIRPNRAPITASSLVPVVSSAK